MTNIINEYYSKSMPDWIKIGLATKGNTKRGWFSDYLLKNFLLENDIDLANAEFIEAPVPTNPRDPRLKEPYIPFFHFVTKKKNKRNGEYQDHHQVYAYGVNGLEILKDDEEYFGGTEEHPYGTYEYKNFKQLPMKTILAKAKDFAYIDTSIEGTKITNKRENRSKLRNQISQIPNYYRSRGGLSDKSGYEIYTNKYKKDLAKLRSQNYQKYIDDLYKRINEVKNKMISVLSKLDIKDFKNSDWHAIIETRNFERDFRDLLSNYNRFIQRIDNAVANNDTNSLINIFNDLEFYDNSNYRNINRELKTIENNIKQNYYVELESLNTGKLVETFDSSIPQWIKNSREFEWIKDNLLDYGIDLANAKFIESEVPTSSRDKRLKNPYIPFLYVVPKREVIDDNGLSSYEDDYDNAVVYIRGLNNPYVPNITGGSWSYSVYLDDEPMKFVLKYTKKFAYIDKDDINSIISNRDDIKQRSKFRNDIQTSLHNYLRRTDVQNNNALYYNGLFSYKNVDKSGYIIDPDKYLDKKIQLLVNDNQKAIKELYTKLNKLRQTLSSSLNNLEIEDKDYRQSNFSKFNRNDIFYNYYNLIDRFNIFIEGLDNTSPEDIEKFFKSNYKGLRKDIDALVTKVKKLNMITLENLQEDEQQLNNIEVEKLIREIENVVDYAYENEEGEDDIFYGTEDSYALEVLEQNLFDILDYSDILNDEQIDTIYNQIIEAFYNDEPINVREILMHALGKTESLTEDLNFNLETNKALIDAYNEYLHNAFEEWDHDMSEDANFAEEFANNNYEIGLCYTTIGDYEEPDELQVTYSLKDKAYKFYINNKLVYTEAESIYQFIKDLHLGAGLNDWAYSTGLDYYDPEEFRPYVELESLNEDNTDIAKANAKKFLEYLNDHDVKSGAFVKKDPEISKTGDNSYMIHLYSQTDDSRYFFNNDGSVCTKERYDNGDGEMVSENHKFIDWHSFYLWVQDNWFWSDDYGADLLDTGMVNLESLDEDIKSRYDFFKDIVVGRDPEEKIAERKAEWENLAKNYDYGIIAINKSWDPEGISSDWDTKSIVFLGDKDSLKKQIEDLKIEARDKKNNQTLTINDDGSITIMYHNAQAKTTYKIVPLSKHIDEDFDGLPEEVKNKLADIANALVNKFGFSYDLVLADLVNDYETQINSNPGQEEALRNALLGIDPDEYAEAITNSINPENRDQFISYTMLESKYSMDEEIKINDKLNPTLWDGKELKPEVKEHIKLIVDKFINNLKEDGIEIKPIDVCIIGSNANFNYTKDSDIDVHIIADTSIENNKELLMAAYQAYKKLFNDKYNITIGDNEIELYVEDGKVNANSNGIYSLEKGWVKEPVRSEIPQIDFKAFNNEFSQWEDEYNSILDSGSVEKIDDFIDRLYLTRQNGILNGGEWSLNNLLFKEFRNLGYLQNLKDKKVELESKLLSL